MRICVDELAAAVDGTLHWSSMPARDGGDTILDHVVIDSRLVETGDLFWGLPGQTHHGAEFAHEALMRGALGVVVDRRVEPLPGCFALQVPDTQLALWQLARWHREHMEATVVAVTGSVGKTTTREMIHRVLGASSTGTASERNLNNHLGVPLSLLRAGWQDEYAVWELGASAAGEIDALARLCEPDIGVITCLGDAHLAGFGSVEAIAVAKAELLAALPAQGCAVLCGDDPSLRAIARSGIADIMWFGRQVDNDVAATHIEYGNGRLHFRVADQKFCVSAWGRHHVTAALAAVAVGQLFGRSLSEIADALIGFESIPMRCEVTQLGPIAVINDAYNASPISMKAALALLREFGTSGRRIVVSGDMRELGTAAEALHYRFGGQVVTDCGADRLIACGEHSETVVRGAREAGMAADYSVACRDTEPAAEHLRNIIRPGDVVLAKGSRVMQMERILAALTKTVQDQVALEIKQNINRIVGVPSIA